MNLFISGWAGFKEALGDIQEDWHFINPFIDFDEKGILDFLKDKSCDKVVGWSTGGHIILKNIRFFSERFNQIIVVAGFRKFTAYVNPRVLKRMIQKLGSEPTIVIRDFLLNAGCNPVFPEYVDTAKLIEGLKFLLFSEVPDKNETIKNLILIHGQSDKILPLKVMEDLRKIYPFCKSYILDKPHWVTFKEIVKIIEASGNT